MARPQTAGDATEERDLVSSWCTQDPAIESWLSDLIRVGTSTDDSILLLGQTGTGKSFLAYQIHKLWARQKGDVDNRKFETVNCAGLTPALAHSQLFGHKKGSFTGATHDQEGAAKRANRGTLFLDEIGDLNAEVQGYLLHALENKEIFPLGAQKPERTEFRLICATNRDPSALVWERSFRMDLYARIRHWVFRLPALADRRGDLPLLVNHFHKIVTEERKCNVSFAKDAMERYLAFAQSAEATWEGNIRDLKQSVSRLVSAAILRGGEVINVGLVNEEICRLRDQWRQEQDKGSDLYRMLLDRRNSRRPDMGLCDATELLLLEQGLEAHSGNMAAAAKELYGVESQRQTKTNPTTMFRRKVARLKRKYPAERIAL